MKFINFKFILLFCILSHRFLATAQNDNILYGIRNHFSTFEFVRINCNNDSLTVLNTLSDFYYSSTFSSCFDAVNQKYFYCTSRELKVLDAQTGHLDTTFDFNSLNPNHIEHIVFNSFDNNIYCIKENWTTLQQVISKINPISGVLTDLFTITPSIEIGVGCKASIDPFLGEYYLQSKKISVIDLNSGTLISNSVITNPTNEWFDHFAYSCKQQRFLGLSNNYHLVENYFSEVNPLSGVSTKVNVLPLNNYFYNHYLSGSTIDNHTDVFYYASAKGKLYGIDINSGNTVYSHNFGPDHQLLFLESASPISCLSDNILSQTSSLNIEVFPNPASNEIVISLQQNPGQATFEVLDLTGKIILEETLINQSTRLNVSTMPKGLYFWKLILPNSVLSDKLVIL